jgi:putative FmdB family regulatory protein
MPIYEYVCESCGRVTEALQRVDDPPLAECGHCGGPLRKLVSAPAFQFKGSGWYVTDYARKSGGGARKPESPRGGEGDAASAPTTESPKTPEGKKDTKPSAKPASDD